MRRISMPTKRKFARLLGSHEKLCPECGKGAIGTRFETDKFVYGTGKDAVELSATVPVHRCEGCNFEFTDEAADRVKHEAICHHLDLLTPREIARIREQYSLSRAEFSRVTKIGEASINRWENGLLLQGASMDLYLYLLSFPENFERIQNRKQSAERKSTTIPEPSVPSHLGFKRFVALEETEEIRKMADAFTLH
jgi:putative zinc finger/helix-turn-helix YgiT family protein